MTSEDIKHQLGIISRAYGRPCTAAHWLQADSLTGTPFLPGNMVKSLWPEGCCKPVLGVAASTVLLWAMMMIWSLLSSDVG